MKNLRIWVFAPVFFLLLIAATLNVLNESSFAAVVNNTNDWILGNFNWLFSSATLVMFFTCVWVMVSPFGHLRIGGEDAKPILNRWQLFAITLCSTIATGILFWGTAEPIFHLETPTHSLGIEPGSERAAEFAISALYFHWSFIPYAIYSVPVLAFALAFYNLKKPFSLSSALFLNKSLKSQTPFYKSLVDVICLFALVAGMAASLGSGILTISGGLEETTILKESELIRIIVSIAIISAFTISASTGILRGIRFLSVINVYLYFTLGLIFLVFVVNWDWLLLVSGSIKDFFQSFFQRSLFTISHPEDSWGNEWTVFNWANWLAWAPVTTFFLGRLTVGYRVREILLYNWIIPSIFAIIWMSIFGGIAVNIHLSGKQDMIQVLNQSGAEAIIYEIMHQLPYFAIISVVFIVTVFVSFVTAADSNTEAMSALSTQGFGTTRATSPVWLKIMWGCLIGITAYIMIRLAGVKGIKMISTIGGFPTLILLIIVNIALLRYSFKYTRATNEGIGKENE